MKYHKNVETVFPENTILFDGVCNFCNGWVNFVLKFDKKKKYKFSFLQEEKGLKFINEFNIGHIDTIILIKKNLILTKSDAALEVMSSMNPIFFFMRIFLLVPRFIRDYVYDLVGKNRYKIFGKTEKCRVPNKVELDRFIL